MEILYSALIVAAAVLTIGSESNNNVAESTTKAVKALKVSTLDVKQNNSSSESFNLSTADIFDMPQWKTDLRNGVYYGWAAYQDSRQYKLHPNKKPTICINDYIIDDNGTTWGNFVCPMYGRGQAETLNDCCGPVTSRRQVCCDQETMMAEFDKTELDIMAVVGIIVAFVAFVSCCVLLYHCCGQRRPNLSKGKILWVKKSPTKKKKLDVVDSAFHFTSMTETEIELSSDHTRDVPEIVIDMVNTGNAHNNPVTILQDNPSTSCAAAKNGHIARQEQRTSPPTDDNKEEDPLLTNGSTIRNV